MSATPRPRGRPKGTGIDDREALRAVAALLARDPTLRPTTAIHRSGISDPSVVRRLRDKLKAVPPPVTAPARRPGPTPSRGAPRPMRRRQQDKRDKKYVAGESGPVMTFADASPSRQDDVAASSPAPETPPDQAPPRPDPDAAPGAGRGPAAASPLADPQLEALRLAAEAAAAVSRLYLHCMNYATATNPMSLALRSQTVMSQWLAGMLGAPLFPFPGTERK